MSYISLVANNDLSTFPDLVPPIPPPPTPTPTPTP
eukprot:CAMPEP_0175065576 /NCGR_PEP_ID=MMETSP0052_2-20121109/16006_1 /TAXON_ID=51329 ORGANISM="Polytomella parva, Strain SAG 63-3" /NCGR_SAMPLE_ID=MMETSP0052_2 /ASSEMBLY_ACC=CAM_ASM_000194 /LENGTH=34 /DNA_ID= /DNA_START= /DNA_END= /DNA_ORIENTATION=